MSEIQIKRLKSIFRHIRNVQQNCELLAERLIEQGDFDFAKRLLINSMSHDKSKLIGIEWEYLHGDVKDNPETQEKFFLAHQQHLANNEHHPEHWGGIEKMPDIYLAEFCCDISARASEFGTDIFDWLNNECLKKYNFTKNSRTYKTIKKYLSLLLEKKFK